MILATAVLVLSTAMFLFYLQSVCQRILAREFDREYFRSLVAANRLEFASVETALRSSDTPLDYPWARLSLQGDFQVLAYLLAHTADPRKRHPRGERLLTAYFWTVFAVLHICHLTGFGEKSVLLELTKVLKFFANVVGRRTSAAHLGGFLLSSSS